MDTDITNDELKQTQAIMKLLFGKIKGLDSLLDDNKESLSYRIAEIMSSSKNLYTKMLPKLLDQENNNDYMDLLVELRMHFLHMLDLINEFEEFFLESIVSEDETEEEAEEANKSLD